ncbi:MAG TPA: 16S rRNA (cytosine(967)-C(5))-methyltransferase RsmB [Syntrophomonas sp.]|jgi:16S rRNA (cytosine967-C5)-methyltransferase|nr:16S rRNA (cytosine(967)-C(5))-methyltransferase RsmB [Syntrophomonas sp.]
MKNKRPQKSDEVRDKALEIIWTVFEKGAYANLQLEKNLRSTQLSVNDRRLTTELVNGTVRMSKHLDWVLNLFLKKSLEHQNPWVRNILRLALYQIMFMDKIPPYASINTAVNQTAARTGSGLTGMVNGVLRNIDRNSDNISYPSHNSDTVAYLAVYYSHPEWLVKQWLEEYGYEQTIVMLRYNNLPAAITLRCNRLKTNPDELIEKLAGEAIETRRCENQPWAVQILKFDKILTGSMPFQQGWFYIQDTASMFAAPILQPEPHQLVYDLCCGLGGKTTHMGEYMQNQGKIKAIDLYQHKIDLLVHNSERLGISIIEAIAADILALDTNRMEKAPRVMLDAPCSGLGVLNRRADARWRKSYQEIEDLIEIQKCLLNQAALLVEPGGLLLYSTCTINRAENEDRIKCFLQAHPEFGLEGFEPALADLPLPADERESVATGMFNLLPGRYGTNGMFYALMRRN